MMRIDSILERHGHSVTVSTSTFYDDLLSEARCSCGWDRGGYLNFRDAEDAAIAHVGGSDICSTCGHVHDWAHFSDGRFRVEGCSANLGAGRVCACETINR
jgi:hypothetical protein